MSDFINTIEVLGDDVLAASIIDRTITEFKDDILTSVGESAFRNCTALTDLELPNAVEMKQYAFQDCASLVRVSLPKFAVNTNVNGLFSGCGKLNNVYVPTLQYIGWSMFAYCYNLGVIDLPCATFINALAFRGKNAQYPAKLKAVVLRSETLCGLGQISAFDESFIESGAGYIYVPRALIEDYKVATNWSTYASQFRVLEDYTLDGTINGKLTFSPVSYDLYGVALSNESDVAEKSYYTTIAPFTGHSITDVVVIMDGADITSSAYHDGVIDIPVVSGPIRIIAKADFYPVISSMPLTADSDLIPLYKLSVKAGQTLRIHYYSTDGAQGYLYDGRGCGSGFQRGGIEINTYATTDVTIVSDGVITFSDHHTSSRPDGTVSNVYSDVIRGKYLYVEIL